ncbi:FAD-dependent oxidoreductase [Nocardioides sp.]|uniref:FAD-dependent oxidoreductase n=1 Tax=Nocardioides sp. TaxID=35761 RepID=UPI0035175593
MNSEHDVDVIVVGSGGGALTGAAVAARAGLRVAVLERTPLLGGTSAYSGGACWLPGTAVQQRAGLPDSTEGARTYLDAVLGEVEPDRRARLEAFLAHAPDLVAELETDPDLDFEWLPFPEYYDAPGRVPAGRSIQPTAITREDLRPEIAALVRPPVERDRAGQPGRRTLSGGQALIARLAMIVAREGGDLRVGHRVTGLVTQADRVVGVRFDGPDGPGELRARRGVLLAAGGFEGDAAARTARGVPGDVAWSMAPAAANTGDAITAAAALAAATDYTGQGWFCPGLAQPDGGGSFTLGFRSGIMVDQHGRRYGNESLPYDRFGRLMAAAPERVPSWFVFDAAEGGRLPGIAMPEGDPEAHLAAGTWVRADTIAGLAAATGLPAAELEEQVARYNGFCETGVDADFGRGSDEYDTFFTGGTGPNRALSPVLTPPFTAARFVLSDLGTKGGLVTDPEGRVLREDGTPIAGLYASSNTTASMFGAHYPGPGAPLGSAMVVASLAVRAMAVSAP